MVKNPDYPGMAEVKSDRKKTVPSYGSKGKNWNWSKLRPDAKIRSDEHLVFRYLVGKLGFTSISLAEVCGCDLDTAKQMFYGRASRKIMRANMEAVTRHLDTTFDSLRASAQSWLSGQEDGETEDITIRVRSLSDENEHYGFQQKWLTRHDLDPLRLFIMKQDTEFMVSEGIRSGDVLLVNKADTQFMAGAFYAAEIAGKVWLGMATRRDGQNRLAVDPSGIKFSLENFDDLEKNGQILGRCVWRSMLM